MITEDQVIEYFSMTMIGAVIPDGTPMILSMSIRRITRSCMWPPF